MQVKIEPQRFDFESCKPIQYIFKNIEVLAEVEKQVIDEKGKVSTVQAVKKILKPCSGKFSPKTFTAIVGPSGCGKTTMLNLLSGRLMSNNLTLYGDISINGNDVSDVGKYKNMIGYVMQDDLMLPTFSPRETFMFVANMRLPNKSQEQKEVIVDNLINSLGLQKCADTYIGNNLIKGISGGERKRTSIGMQLLTNPSLLFLDQPTTGLDSTTALNLIRFLNEMAQAGRTIISTIHQPSSEIFQQFDKLFLMVDGNIIYNGNARDSIEYFAVLQMPVPVHSNPIDHYMKLMNKEGIMLTYIEHQKQFTQEQVQSEFDEKIEFLVNNYKKSQKQQKIVVKDSTPHNEEYASWCSQFCHIMGRAFRNQFRNPLGMKAKIGQMVFFAIITIILFERIAEDQTSFIQNLTGSVFFLVMNAGFSSVFGALNVFNIERPVFIRQRLSNTYTTSAYFFSRTLAYFPQEMILPFIIVVISYFAINLNQTAASFFLTYLSIFLVSWMGSGYGLLLSTLFKDAQIAMALVPVLIIPFLLVGGFFAPLANVPDFYKIFEYLSMFKYGYQAAIYSQFFDGLSVTGTTVSNDQEVTYTYSYDQAQDHYLFDDPYWLNFMMMAIFGFVLRIFAFIAMYVISNPRSLKLKKSKDEQGKKTQA